MAKRQRVSSQSIKPDTDTVDYHTDHRTCPSTHCVASECHASKRDFNHTTIHRQRRSVGGCEMLTGGSQFSQSVNADVEMLGEFFDPDKPPASIPARHSRGKCARRGVQHGRTRVRVRLDQIAQEVHRLLCFDLLLAGFKRKIQETDRRRHLPAVSPRSYCTFWSITCISGSCAA